MKEYILHLIVGYIKLHVTECCFMGFCYYMSPLLVRHIRAILVFIDNDILTRIFARNVLCIPLLLIGRQPPLHIVIAAWQRTSRRCLHKSLSLGHSQTNLHGTRLIAIFSKFSLFSFLLNCELHFLYSALIDIGEDEGVAQGFSLFHRLLYVGHLALGKYVLEEDA